ncbi:MAG: hypothetical protein ACOCTT_02185, partial [archaeon]
KKVAEEVNEEVYNELKNELSQEKWDKLKEKGPGNTQFKLEELGKNSSVEESHRDRADIGAKVRIKGGSREDEVEQFWRSNAEREMSKVGANILEGIEEAEDKKTETKNVLARGTSKAAKEKLKKADSDEKLSEDQAKQLFFKLNLDVMTKKAEDPVFGDENYEDEEDLPTLSEAIEQDPYRTLDLSQEEIEDIGDYYVLNSIGEENLSKEEKNEMKRIKNKLNLKEEVGTENLELHRQLSERFSDELEKRQDTSGDAGGVEEALDTFIEEAFEKGKSAREVQKMAEKAEKKWWKKHQEKRNKKRFG